MIEAPAFELGEGGAQGGLIRRTDPFWWGDFFSGYRVEAMLVMPIGLTLSFVHMRVVVPKDGSVFNIGDSSMKCVALDINVPPLVHGKDDDNVQIYATKAVQTSLDQDLVGIYQNRDGTVFDEMLELAQSGVVDRRIVVEADSLASTTSQSSVLW